MGCGIRIRSQIYRHWSLHQRVSMRRWAMCQEALRWWGSLWGQKSWSSIFSLWWIRIAGGAFCDASECELLPIRFFLTKKGSYLLWNIKERGDVESPIPTKWMVKLSIMFSLFSKIELLVPPMDPVSDEYIIIFASCVRGVNSSRGITHSRQIRLVNESSQLMRDKGPYKDSVMSSSVKKNLYNSAIRLTIAF